MTSASRGLIALFARHRTAANLLMVLMILFGALGLARMNTQFFPTFGIDWISASVTWPGASAEDVDANVVAAIEPEVRFLDGVKRVVSQSVEGVGSIIIEFHAGRIWIRRWRTSKMPWAESRRCRRTPRSRS